MESPGAHAYELKWDGFRAIVSNRNDARDFDANGHTRAQARSIARKLRVHYTEDC
jgi:hypothetical protein